MSRWALLVLLPMVPACSDLTEGEGGVIALQINQPPADELEVGQTMALTATALDKDGNPIPAAVTWRAPDATLTVDPATGVITGVSPGTGRVQAFAGELGSNLLSFTVLSRADTLIVTDSVLTVGPGLNSPALVAQLQTFTPPGQGVANRPVVYTVTSPPDVPPATVEFSGGGRTVTVNTGTDGAVSTVTLNRVLTVAQPDTAIVDVRAFRPDGSPVPGSGQRFIVLFQ